MIKNFIWDFDGMLFDSYPHITRAFAKMMKEDGIDIDEPAVQKMFEINFDTVFKHFGTSEEQKERFRKYEHDFCLEPLVVPFPNTIETLKETTHIGKNFLYTHRGKSVFCYLKKYGIYDCFTDFITSEDGFSPKPAPDAVEYFLKKYSLKKDETVMIGDREIDVLSGKNAGTYGCLFTKEKKETAADFVIDDIKKILDI